MPLPLVESSVTASSSRSQMAESARTLRMLAKRAELNRLWLHYADWMTPHPFLRNQHLHESWYQLMVQSGSIKGMRIADLGCGSGHFAKKLADAGAEVVALDASSYAVERTKKRLPHSQVLQNTLPKTLLEDDSFDWVVCLDLVGDLDPRDQRLLFSEMARILKRDGSLLFTTPIEPKTYDALEILSGYAMTEFTISNWQVHHHYIQESFLRFFSHEYRQFLKGKSSTEGREWEPLTRWIQSWDRLLQPLETLSRTLWREKAITHAGFIGRKKSLFPTQ